MIISNILSALAAWLWLQFLLSSDIGSQLYLPSREDAQGCKAVFVVKFVPEVQLEHGLGGGVWYCNLEVAHQSGGSTMTELAAVQSMVGIFNICLA